MESEFYPLWYLEVLIHSQIGFCSYIEAAKLWTFWELYELPVQYSVC